MKESSPSPVAIIGIDCIFAKSQDKKAFYHLVSKGVSGITDPPDTHQHLADYYDPDPKKPDHIYCNRGGYLPSIKFDPTEFNIPPNVIEATDTSQLLSLVTAKRAMDDAGYGENGKAFDPNKASVILGVTGTQELVIPLGARLGHPIWRRALKNSGVSEDKSNEVIQRISEGYVSWQENSFPGLLGNVVAGRIANRLDLGGTNCVVDAACASSMGAIHVALLELRSGRSDMVITGGVDTINDAFMHMCFSKTKILSETGDIRPFSKDADGTVLGEGIGIVVMKRLEDAERDGDRIYAVIKGLGSSSDGKAQSIYAPRPEGQAKALRRAYEEAQVDPTSVSLVEAHGTGTRVGDVVEFKTLCDVFGETSPNGNGCAIGSVKSNIGHTKAAAGTAGLIKTALSIYHKVLLPTRNAENADPKLGVESSPFYLNTQLRPWVSKKQNHRRAGVSAFGFGGSNFHAVLEEHTPTKLEPSWDGTVEIAAFSGLNEQALMDQIKAWSNEAAKEASAHNIGKLAKQSRKQFKSDAPLRLAMVLDLGEEIGDVSKICEDAIERISDPNATGNHAIFVGRGNPNGKLAFMFPGQGSQYVGMGKDLVCCFPESLDAFQEASGHLSDDDGLDDYVFPRMMADPGQAEQELRQTQIAQPAIGAVSVSMFNALSSFGLVPDATCGHSYGELVALHAAGWMDRNDLWNLSVQRGLLMAQAGTSAGDSGTMLAVKAPVDEIAELVDTLDEEVVLANRNSKDQGVLSGTKAGIDAAEAACRQKKWRTIKLPVAAAFHSPLVADAQKPFGECVQSVPFTPNSTVVTSNTLGGLYPEATDEIKTTLGKQLACPVDFVSNVETLYEKGIRTFVEVGPKTVLTQLVRSTLNDDAVTAIALDQSMGRDSGIKDLASALSHLAVLGFPVQLNRWETPRSKSRKARMTIDLSGANIRNPRAPKKAPSAQPKRVRVDHDRNKSQTASLTKAQINAAPTRAALNHTVTSQSPAETNTNASQTRPAMDPREKQSVQNALTTVQQGLASIQALQTQTAQAHQKFLDTQAEASKTLQQMIHSAQQLAMQPNGNTYQSADVPPQPVERVSAPKIVPMEEVSTLQDHEKPPAPAYEVRSQAIPSSPPAPEQKNTAPISEANDEVEKNLVTIVSELTGYPAEMLGMEMDIESDLGIDSIKRVEILSALEEKMPHLPKVTPDMMGSLKTMGQIIEFLSISTASETPDQASSTPPQPAAAEHHREIQQTLTAIVSNLTGYPSEMLGTDMDIESDLGIDSIKRVEILSALEEKMPHLPKVTPDMMGTLKTMGQITAFLSDAPAGAEPAQAQAPAEQPAEADHDQEIQHALTGIVSNLTGYPVEMLGAEMDIEADLGIDSIKRVEILSALEEKMPHLPKVTPDMMGTLKTMGQISGFLSASPASSEPAPPRASVAQPAEADRHKEIRHTLTGIVSDLTGYPVEMLGAEMDIEADLGIDSIKRVEILSALEEKMPHLPKVTPDMMGTLKSLDQIVEFLAGPAEKQQPVASRPDTKPQTKIHVVPDPEDNRPEINKPEINNIDRQVIRMIPLETIERSSCTLPEGYFIGVVGGSNGLDSELITRFKENGINAQRLNRIDMLTVDLSLAGMILLAPMAADEAFQWAKASAPLLQQASKKTNACFVSISAIDGAFGFSGRSMADPVQGALAGLVKTAAIEWPAVNCLALDVDPQWQDMSAVARALCDNILYSDPNKPIEIGLGPNGRVGFKLASVVADKDQTVDLGLKDVVVVTGGARGVTAAASMALAAHTPCTLVLMGRSPEPQPEPEWLAPLTNEGDIKKAILNQHSRKGNITPRDIEIIYKQWMANRQVLYTIDQLQQMGASAHYLSTDVRNSDMVEAQLTKIRNEIGPIRALIHGAGVIEDRFIVDKAVEQFKKVYDTKVQGLNALLQAMDEDELKFVVLFSSVAARMGNQGQVDYAMANEVLNKTACQLSGLRPNCKVVSINWGPWDGGMVTPSLRRNFKKNNVPLIPVEAGAQAMVTEMAQPAGGAVEVVIGGPLPSVLNQQRRGTKEHAADLMVTCKRDISLERYPVLSDHQLDGRPVVPLALITEWLAHSALHANPGLVLHGMDNLRLLNGIILDQQKRMIRFLAGKVNRNNGQYEVPVEIRDDINNGVDRVHSSARAILADTLPEPPAFHENGHFKPGDPISSLDEIYNDVLFHGKELRGIIEIIRISQEGISARLATAPPPAHWINEPLRSRWIADPLVLDSAFQMAIVWCHQQHGLVSLPSFAASYRQYCSRFPKNGVSAVLEIQKSNNRKMVGDFTFLDQDKKVLARLKGYEAIMDPGLNKAFKAA